MSDGALDDPAARMLESWRSNAAAWTGAVRERRIASRRAGTDAAVVETVLRERCARVVDLGCGEGWLARALAERGCEVVGVDASEALIAAARALGGARFETMPYAEIAGNAQALGAPFDVAVFNFALLDADAQPALRVARALLGAGGRLVVQTVHPWSAAGDAPYADGWRVETFANFGDGFVAPMPWYFRTLGSWLASIREAGFAVERCEEPVDAATGKPLSLLVTARAEA